MSHFGSKHFNFHLVKTNISKECLNDLFKHVHACKTKIGTRLDTVSGLILITFGLNENEEHQILSVKQHKWMPGGRQANKFNLFVLLFSIKKKFHIAT